MKNVILVHYGEIGTKGKNRQDFEHQLVENLRTKLGQPDLSVRCDFGRIVVEGNVTSDLETKIAEVFGIAHFSFALKVSADMDSIQKGCLELLGEATFVTFGICTHRATKDFPLKSSEINEELGTFVLNHFTSKKVNLTDPDIWVYVDIVGKNAYLYTHKIPGLGGLPVKVSGRGLVMISGGIDSPVATYFMMKRGMRCDFIHFHTYPCTERESIDKVEKLVAILNKYQFEANLYLVPFGKLQKEIVRLTNPRYRILLYRRFMMRVAQEVAKINDIRALVTGESLGQVASQTIENINITENVTTLPVLRPLIGLDKTEIINKAKEIGTYEISILPHEDCCTRFVPKHPVTKGRLDDVISEEASLDVSSLVGTCLREIELHTLYL